MIKRGPGKAKPPPLGHTNRGAQAPTRWASQLIPWTHQGHRERNSDLNPIPEGWPSGPPRQGTGCRGEHLGAWKTNTLGSRCECVWLSGLFCPGCAAFPRRHHLSASVPLNSLCLHPVPTHLLPSPTSPSRPLLGHSWAPSVLGDHHAVLYGN